MEPLSSVQLGSVFHRGCITAVSASASRFSSIGIVQRNRSSRVVFFSFSHVSPFLILLRRFAPWLSRNFAIRSLDEQLLRSRPLFLIFVDPIFSKYLLSVFRSRASARKEMEQRWEILITPLQGSYVERDRRATDAVPILSKERSIYPRSNNEDTSRRLRRNQLSPTESTNIRVFR